MLNWQTSIEVNNYGFEIERCQNLNVKSEVWEKIGFVEGHGNSNSPKNYLFADFLTSISGKYYYRLKQIDGDGNYKYSNVIEVIIPASKFDLSQNYPNPFNPTTTIEFGLPQNGNTRLSVLNILGEEIEILLDEVKEAGYYSIDFNARDIPSGAYFYRIQSGNFIETKKMLLLK